MRAGFLVLIVCFAVFGGFGVCSGDGLKNNFYKNSCPNVEKIVRTITWNLTKANPVLGAKLLRLHYHDCFVRGCDASLLLDRAGNQTEPSEKEGFPNQSVSGFDVIETIKTQIEQVCPGTVSCADIVALAARDAVSFQFQKPIWDVLTGRRDGNVSLASELTANLPSPFADFSALNQLFKSKGFNVKDLVALSGAHTIGVAHCGAFAGRLNLTGNGDVDPSLDPFYADFLKKQCPTPADPTTTVEMDPQSSLSFDSHYFTTLDQNKGLFQSDASLLTNNNSKKIAQTLRNPKAFLGQFAKSVKKMGAIDVLTGSAGEIRKQCNKRNS